MKFISFYATFFLIGSLLNAMHDLRPIPEGSYAVSSPEMLEQAFCTAFDFNKLTRARSKLLQHDSKLIEISAALDVLDLLAEKGCAPALMLCAEIAKAVGDHQRYEFCITTAVSLSNYPPVLVEAASWNITKAASNIPVGPHQYYQDPTAKKLYDMLNRRPALITPEAAEKIRKVYHEHYPQGFNFAEARPTTQEDPAAAGDDQNASGVKPLVTEKEPVSLEQKINSSGDEKIRTPDVPHNAQDEPEEKIADERIEKEKSPLIKEVKREQPTPAESEQKEKLEKVEQSKPQPIVKDHGKKPIPDAPQNIWHEVVELKDKPSKAIEKFFKIFHDKTSSGNLTGQALEEIFSSGVYAILESKKDKEFDCIYPYGCFWEWVTQKFTWRDLDKLNQLYTFSHGPNVRTWAIEQARDALTRVVFDKYRAIKKLDQMVQDKRIRYSEIQRGQAVGYGEVLRKIVDNKSNRYRRDQEHKDNALLLLKQYAGIGQKDIPEINAFINLLAYALQAKDSNVLTQVLEKCACLQGDQLQEFLCAPVHKELKEFLKNPHHQEQRKLYDQFLAGIGLGEEAILQDQQEEEIIFDWGGPASNWADECDDTVGQPLPVKKDPVVAGQFTEIEKSVGKDFVPTEVRQESREAKDNNAHQEEPKSPQKKAEDKKEPAVVKTMWEEVLQLEDHAEQLHKFVEIFEREEDNLSLNGLDDLFACGIYKMLFQATELTRAAHVYRYGYFWQSVSRRFSTSNLNKLNNTYHFTPDENAQEWARSEARNSFARACLEEPRALAALDHMLQDKKIVFADIQVGQQKFGDLLYHIVSAKQEQKDHALLLLRRYAGLDGQNGIPEMNAFENLLKHALDSKDTLLLESLLNTLKSELKAQELASFMDLPVYCQLEEFLKSSGDVKHHFWYAQLLMCGGKRDAAIQYVQENVEKGPHLRWYLIKLFLESEDKDYRRQAVSLFQKAKTLSLATSDEELRSLIKEVVSRMSEMPSDGGEVEYMMARIHKSGLGGVVEAHNETALMLIHKAIQRGNLKACYEQLKEFGSVKNVDDKMLETVLAALKTIYASDNEELKSEVFGWIPALLQAPTLPLKFAYDVCSLLTPYDISAAIYALATAEKALKLEDVKSLLPSTLKLVASSGALDALKKKASANATIAHWVGNILAYRSAHNIIIIEKGGVEEQYRQALDYFRMAIVQSRESKQILDNCLKVIQTEAVRLMNRDLFSLAAEFLRELLKFGDTTAKAWYSILILDQRIQVEEPDSKQARAMLQQALDSNTLGENELLNARACMYKVLLEQLNEKRGTPEGIEIRQQVLELARLLNRQDLAQQIEATPEYYTPQELRERATGKNDPQSCYDRGVAAKKEGNSADARTAFAQAFAGGLPAGGFEVAKLMQDGLAEGDWPKIRVILESFMHPMLESKDGLSKRDKNLVEDILQWLFKVSKDSQDPYPSYLCASLEIKCYFSTKNDVFLENAKDALIFGELLVFKMIHEAKDAATKERAKSRVSIGDFGIPDMFVTAFRQLKAKDAKMDLAKILGDIHHRRVKFDFAFLEHHSLHIKEALQWLEKARELGAEGIGSNLADLYMVQAAQFVGNGKMREAKEAYDAACARSNDSDVALVVRSLFMLDYSDKMSDSVKFHKLYAEKALEDLKKAAVTSNEAKGRLGALFLNGRQVGGFIIPKDLAQGMNYLKQAADAGDYKAQVVLASCFRVKLDFDEAEKYYRMARKSAPIEKRDVMQLSLVGLLYMKALQNDTSPERGNLFKKVYKKCEKLKNLTNKSVNSRIKGTPDFFLGAMQLFGHYVPASFDAAVECFVTGLDNDAIINVLDVSPLADLNITQEFEKHLDDARVHYILGCLYYAKAIKEEQSDAQKLSKAVQMLEKALSEIDKHDEKKVIRMHMYLADALSRLGQMLRTPSVQVEGYTGSQACFHNALGHMLKAIYQGYEKGAPKFEFISSLIGKILIRFMMYPDYIGQITLALGQKECNGIISDMQ